MVIDGEIIALDPWTPVVYTLQDFKAAAAVFYVFDHL